MRICKNNREIEWKPNKNRGIRIINKKNKKEAKEKAVCEAFRKLLSFFENYLKIGIQRMLCQLLFRIRANDKSQNQKNPP